jgi:2-succinyl-5-enolpyruvyl-6-hydroxy-3-cyclohexene-1-carboxylate synthase
LADAVVPRVTAADEDWRHAWTRAERRAEAVITRELAAPDALTEPYIAYTVARLALDNSAVVAASSMPVRDIEWYGGCRDRIVHYSNRGANGIDGVVSTSIGIALTGQRVVALVGDIAFLHDSSALIALARRAIDLTVVVVDNDGGGIFSFLAQADALDHERFEQLFGTPHGTDLAALARAHHLETEVVDRAEAFSAAFTNATAASGVRVIVARTDRADNVTVHRAIHDAVARAITA